MGRIADLATRAKRTFAKAVCLRACTKSRHLLQTHDEETCAQVLIATAAQSTQGAASTPSKVCKAAERSGLFVQADVSAHPILRSQEPIVQKATEVQGLGGLKDIGPLMTQHTTKPSAGAHARSTSWVQGSHDAGTQTEHPAQGDATEPGSTITFPPQIPHSPPPNAAAVCKSSDAINHRPSSSMSAGITHHPTSASLPPSSTVDMSSICKLAVSDTVASAPQDNIGLEDESLYVPGLELAQFGAADIQDRPAISSSHAPASLPATGVPQATVAADVSTTHPQQTSSDCPPTVSTADASTAGIPSPIKPTSDDAEQPAATLLGNGIISIGGAASFEGVLPEDLSAPAEGAVVEPVAVVTVRSSISDVQSPEADLTSSHAVCAITADDSLLSHDAAGPPAAISVTNGGAASVAESTRNAIAAGSAAEGAVTSVPACSADDSHASVHGQTLDTEQPSSQVPLQQDNDSENGQGLLAASPGMEGEDGGADAAGELVATPNEESHVLLPELASPVWNKKARQVMGSCNEDWRLVPAKWNPKFWVLDPDVYADEVFVIGRGGQASLTYAQYKDEQDTWVPAAIKWLDCSKLLPAIGAKRELEAMMALQDSAHVVQLVSEPDEYVMVEGTPNMYLAMEYINNVGVLEHFAGLRSWDSQGMDRFLDAVIGVFHDIVQGVLDIHAAGWSHLNLKPDNVCLELKDGGVQGKVIDFGSTYALGAKPTANLQSTYEYASPQVLRTLIEGFDANKVDYTSQDCYSLGCILLEMLTCETAVDVSEEMAAEAIEDCDEYEYMKVCLLINKKGETADKLAGRLQSAEKSQESVSEQQMDPLTSLFAVARDTQNVKLSALLELASNMMAYSAKKRCSVTAALSMLEAI